MATVYWMDSCSAHYNDAYLLNKWTTRGSAAIVVDPTGGYDGRPCLDYTGVGSSLTKNIGQNLSTLAVGVRHLVANLSVGTNVGINDGSTNQIIACLNASGNIQVRRNGTGGTLLQTSTLQVQVGDWIYLELLGTIHNSSGTYEARVNGVTVCTGTNADTQQSANAYGNTLYVGVYGSESVMDVYVASELLGDVKVLYLPPMATGTTTQWNASTGSNYACVDETTTPSTTDYVESGTPGNIDTYATTDISGSGDVHAVQALMLAAKTDAGTRTAKLVLRAGGSNQESSSTFGIGVSSTYYTEIWNTDPSDSNPWTVSDINALEVGVKDQA